MNDDIRKNDDLKLKQLICEYKDGNLNAMNELFLLCEPLVLRMSSKYYSIAIKRNIPLEDLKQEAYIGLCGAIKHFVNHGDNSFISYAFSAMNYQMLVYIRNNSNLIVKTNYNKGFADICSFNCPASETSDAELGDSIADYEQELEFIKIEKAIDRRILKAELQKMLASILVDTNDTEIINAMYNLDGKNMSYDAICSKYHMTLRQLIYKERTLIIKVRTSEYWEKSKNEFACYLQ